MSIKKFLIAGCAFAGLAACGDTGTNQALLGGAAGAGVAVVADANPIKGAVVGAAGNFIYCQANPGKCN
jgi:osmotically inducible lipoprotein OsmB